MGIRAERKPYTLKSTHAALPQAIPQEGDDHFITFSSHPQTLPQYPNLVDPSGHVEPHVWETGKAYWLPAMVPNTLHSDMNAGDKPMEVMFIELNREIIAPGDLYRRKPSLDT